MSKEKDLLKVLEDRGLLEYGAFIPGGLVRETMETELPELCTVAQFRAAGLVEMSAVDYVRNVLLGRGMYLAADGMNYRILTRAQNRQQIEAYMRQADAKLRRGLKLSRNTPPAPGERPSQYEARFAMKRESVRESRANL